MRPIQVVILLILMLPLVSAYQGSYAPNSAVSFPSNCLSAEKVFVTSTQNITFFYPNGSTFINNTAMVEIATGQFHLNFTTPNTTGTYTAKKRCVDVNASVAYGGDTFEVIDMEKRTGMSAVAVSLLLLGFVAFILFSAKELMAQKLQGDYVTKTMGKFLNTNTLGVFMFLLGSWLMVVIYAIALFLSNGTTYYNVLNALMVPVILLVAFFNLAYVVLYILFLIYTQWGEPNSAWWKVKK